MPYLMRKLIVDELRLRDTFRIIGTYLNGFDDGEVSIPNFSHYGSENEDIAIMLRVNYQDDVVEKAVRLLNQLVTNGDINRISNDWENMENVSSVVRNACFKAFQCASAISQLSDFENVDQTHPINPNFSICFFHVLFTQLNINDRLQQRDIENFCTGAIQNIIDHAIDAIDGINLRREDFYDPHFFERFVHMFCDNLLISRNSEAAFWNLFYVRNAPWLFLDDCRQRFCEDLARP